MRALRSDSLRRLRTSSQTFVQKTGRVKSTVTVSSHWAEWADLRAASLAYLASLRAWSVSNSCLWEQGKAYRIVQTAIWSKKGLCSQRLGFGFDVSMPALISHERTTRLLDCSTVTVAKAVEMSGSAHEAITRFIPPSHLTRLAGGVAWFRSSNARNVEEPRCSLDQVMPRH